MALFPHFLFIFDLLFSIFCFLLSCVVTTIFSCLFSFLFPLSSFTSLLLSNVPMFQCSMSETTRRWNKKRSRRRREKCSSNQRTLPASSKAFHLACRPVSCSAVQCRAVPFGINQSEPSKSFFSFFFFVSCLSSSRLLWCFYKQNNRHTHTLTDKWTDG